MVSLIIAAEATALDLEKRSRLHFTHKAMGSTFEIILDVDRDRAALEDIAHAAFELIDELEWQLSAYVSTSDICYINREAVERPVRVEPGVYRLLKTCRQLHSETEGALDVTVGPVVRAWGFYEREGRVPDPTQLQEALGRVGMENVELGDEERTVRFTKPGVEINLGAIGKGYAVDRVVEALRSWGVHCALVNAGNSSIAVMGDPPGGRGWPLGVADPGDPDKALGLLMLTDASMSTSGSWQQFFKLEGHTYSHIIDPRTGQPTEGMLSTVVTGKSATITDGLSTAFFVMGVDKTRRYCHEHPDIAAVLIAGDCPGQIEIHTIGCTLEKED